MLDAWDFVWGRNNTIESRSIRLPVSAQCEWPEPSISPSPLPSSTRQATSYDSNDWPDAMHGLRSSEIDRCEDRTPQASSLRGEFPMSRS